jgi:hypothetical protein
MSIQGIGGAGLLASTYQSLMRSVDQAADATSTGASSDATGSGATSGGASGGSAAAAASPGGSLLSGANALALNGLQPTGEVSATLPDGLTLSIVSFVPSGSDPGQAGSSSGAAGGSSGTSSGGPDFAAMAAALEQMVQQFMNAGIGGLASSSSSAAAQSAYQQGASSSSTQGGGTGAVA